MPTGGGGGEGVQRHAGGVHALGGGGEGQARARDTCFQVTAKSKSKRERRTNAWGANESSRVVQWQLVPLGMFSHQDKVAVGVFRLIQFLVEATCIRSNFLGPNVPLGMFGHQVGP